MESNLGATYFHFRRSVVLNQLKSKCGLLLAKATALRVTLNLDGAPIASNSVYERRVNFLALDCSLSLHRHPHMYFVFNFRFVDS